jgi:hypothetical protein
MLLDLEQQIVSTIGNLGGFKEFTPSLVAQALSDRELLTLELWAGEAGEEDNVISDECQRRQAEYEKFTRRLASRGES